MERQDIKSMSYEELMGLAQQLGEPSYRMKQIYQWLHEKGAASFGEMTNLSKSLREKLEKEFELPVLEIVQMLESHLDGTRKYLFRLPDGNVIESVWMKYKHGNSVCISTQVGCRMGCTFCASTLGGLVRNLTCGEMLEQVYRITQSTGERVSNVVLMGSGEPLDNFDQVIRFLQMISDEHGLHISQRNLTLSTCGLVPEIKALGDLDFAITLAISLHAADDETRRQMMPIARKYSIEEILAACREYLKRTGRRITFEYSLAEGVNDSDEEAALLAKELRGLCCHVNLIPINPVKERNYRESARDHIQAFKNKLEKNGINVTIRREMGRDINGACGQLRRDFLKEGSMNEER